MDNLCHTLAGAALAEAGLKHRTRFGAATLLISANLPDVDVLAFLGSTPAVALRRGWTHGVLAQALLPAALAGVMLLLARWRPPRSPSENRAHPGALFGLALLGVLSHVGLDWLNTYGVRLLMPLTDRWFYGDAVFIIDPWLWLTLGLGVVAARRRRTAGPARVALVVAGAYIAVVVGSAAAARRTVAEAWSAGAGVPPASVMVGPVPANPFAKTVIVDGGDYYQRGAFDWRGGQAVFQDERVPRRDRHPAVLAAIDDPAFRAVLVWARFPRFEVEPLPGGTRVTLSDMRFGARLGAVTTVVPDR
jgi:inner membrane protein